MSFTLEETFEVLERTPTVLDSLLRGSSPGWHRADEGPTTWSPIQVVGHLIDADETNWVPRARTILEEGEGRPIAGFDRFAHLERFADRSLEELLDLFADTRRANLETVRGWGLTDRELSLRGRHPDLGAVTLRQLLATWAVHDLDHVAQVVRVMAGRYAGEVGPWREYLRIVRG